jgi:hypothetical protein
MTALHTLGILSTSFTWNAFPTVLKEFPHCWLLFLHSAVQINPNHLNWVLGRVIVEARSSDAALNHSPSCQSSSQITAPVHRWAVYRWAIYLIPILYLFIYLALLHPSISICTFIFCTSIIPVFNCYIVITSPPWPIYLLILPNLHSPVYRLFCSILSTVLSTVCFVYSMCNSVLYV